ncbi:MAG: ABC transporter permease [Actinobacteria bacterium]|nr:ABC transporter permease [Actinomycetota bacterium]
MSARRVLAIAGKCLHPRNPYLLFALLGPFIYVAIFQLVFGLFRDRPRLAVHEEGNGEVVRLLEETEAVELLKLGSRQEVEEAVEGRKADLGVDIGGEVKETLAAGGRASLGVYVGGESLAKDRAVALAVLADALRSLSPAAPRLSFELVKLGEEKALSLMEMFLPFFAILIIVLGSYLLPASFMVSEKEGRTLTALLVTPATLAEVMLAFGLVGVVISLAMGMIVLSLTVGLAQPLLLLAIFTVGSVLGAEWGLLLGLLARDQATLMAYLKGLNIFLVAPALFVVFPDWPQWIGRIFPVYYIGNPVFRVCVYGEGWREVGWQVLALCGFTALFSLPLAALVARTRASADTRMLGASS